MKTAGMTARSAEVFRGRQVPAGLAELRDRDERLESLKLIVRTISHNFNNFLAPILGYVSLIKEEVEGTSPAFRYAETMEQSARRAEAEISSAMFAAQPQRKFHPTWVDFTTLLNEEIDAWMGVLGSGSGIEVVRDLAACQTQLDDEQWRAAVRHLLKNVRFALPMGGRIEIGLRSVSLSADRAKELGLANTKGWVLEVQDNGLGMSDEILRKAFDPFFTTRPKSHSLGLGLTLVHGVVRLHGGQVVIESVEDGGACVRIWLPSIDPAPVGAVETPASPQVALSPSGLAEGKRILLVDDEPLVLEVLKSCLEKCRYQVQTASDGAQALKIFEKNPQEWLLVVSDLTMPNMNGVELVARIRATRPETKVLFVSGDSDASQSSGLSLLQPHVPTLLKKPFTLKTLSQTVEKLIAGA